MGESGALGWTTEQDLIRFSSVLFQNDNIKQNSSSTPAASWYPCLLRVASLFAGKYKQLPGNDQSVF